MEGMLVGVHCDTHLSSEESREDFVFFLPDLHMIFDAIVDALRSWELAKMVTEPIYGDVVRWWI